MYSIQTIRQEMEISRRKPHETDPKGQELNRLMDQKGRLLKRVLDFEQAGDPFSVERARDTRMQIGTIDRIIEIVERQRENNDKNTG
mgnify:CR=1 FL=1